MSGARSAWGRNWRDEAKRAAFLAVFRARGAATVSATKGRGMRYLVVIEKGPVNYGAYVSDLPGCVSTGATVEEVMAGIREALALHLEGMLEDGDPITPPTSVGVLVDVEVAVAVAAPVAGDAA